MLNWWLQYFVVSLFLVYYYFCFFFRFWFLIFISHFFVRSIDKQNFCFCFCFKHFWTPNSLVFSFSFPLISHFVQPTIQQCNLKLNEEIKNYDFSETNEFVINVRRTVLVDGSGWINIPLSEFKIYLLLMTGMDGECNCCFKLTWIHLLDVWKYVNSALWVDIFYY